jgi:hypothetical protein
MLVGCFSFIRRKNVKRRLLLTALTLAGCGGSQPAPSSAPVPEAPLNSFASIRMIVMPTQGVRSGDALGWAARTGERRAFLAAVDSALEASGSRPRPEFVGVAE